MKKLKKYIPVITAFVLGIIAVYFLIFGARYYNQTVQKKYSEELHQYINNDLTYEQNNWDSEIDTMMNWIDNAFVSDSDRGLLYERIANIYQFQDDTMNYYQYLGYALYYLEKSNSYDVAANIYTDLANYYVNNNSFSRAAEMLERAGNLCDIDDLNDLQVKSYIYRMLAVISDYHGNYEMALEQIAKSSHYIDQSTSGYFEEPYYAINDAVSANIYFNMCEYDKAQALIDKQKNSEYFQATKFKDVLVRDFIIPYYSAWAKLAAYNHDSNTREIIQEYCTYCEDYGYRKVELKTLMYIKRNLRSGEAEENTIVDNKIDDAYLIITDMQSEEYSLLIDGQLLNSMEQKRLLDEKTNEEKQRSIRASVTIWMILLFVLVVIFILHQSSLDELTKVKNRRAFQTHIWFHHIQRNKFAAIMIDIDNFKIVNDTYGHKEGDYVLQKLGSILKKIAERDAHAYRYGGEEFILLLDNNYLERVLGIAEHIRQQVEDMEWNHDQHITISLGVSINATADTAVQEADENLYFSKANGKNVITYTLEGKKTLYHKYI